MPGHTFHLIPHTHWDREWYLPESVFLTRLVPTLDDLIARLTSEPDTTFLLDGQTVLLEDYLRVRPEREAEVVELVRAGRLQTGPWYVLADELIPSGESLIRNLLAGHADSERLGGQSEVLYSPDAFGHPSVWPTLAAEFGFRYGVIWRGLGGEAGQERDFYRWRGPDGREILLYHLPPDGYEIGASLPADDRRLAEEWQRIRSVLLPRASTQQVAVFVGADHHALHPALGRLRTLLAQLDPGSEFRISRLQDFFAAAAAEVSSSLPLLSGELRWSYGYTWTLQGVHATRAALKRRHAAAELALTRLAEPLAALAQVTRGGDRRALLRHAWRVLLRSQFHDSIAGTTSDAVARRVELRLDDARRLASEIARTSLNELVGNDPDRARGEPEATSPRLVLWNPVARRRRTVAIADLSWFRRDVLVGPPGDRLPRVGSGQRLFHLIGPSGEIPVQPLGGGSGQERLDSYHHYPDQDEVDWTRVAFRTPEIGGMGLATLEAGEISSPVSGTVWQQGRMLGNELLDLKIAPNGTLQLSDRRNRQVFRDLLVIESSGDVGDTYSYCPPPRDRIHRVHGRVQVRALAAGPLVGALEARWRFNAGRGVRGEGVGSVGVRLIVSLYAGCPTVRCTLELDNRASNHRLRLRVPTGISQGAAVAGTQFGVENRAPVVASRSYPRETPVATAPAHRFVAHAQGARGLAVFAPGFFEYELDRKGDLLATLFRSVGELSRDDLPTRRGHAGWPMATPLAQGHGPQRIQLAVAPITETEVAGGTVLPELWEDLFLPVQGVWLRQASPLDPESIDLRLEGYGLVFSGMKPAERGEGMVLRCYNATGRPTAGLWHFSEPVASAQRGRADERALHDIRLGEGGRIVPFHAAAHEIVTIMVSLARPR